MAGLTPLKLESETSKVIGFDPARCQEFFRLAHAMVYQVAQGRTLPGTVCLWETGSPYFSAKHLLVGLSRATAAQLRTSPGFTTPEVSSCAYSSAIDSSALGESVISLLPLETSLVTSPTALEIRRRSSRRSSCVVDRSSIISL